VEGSAVTKLPCARRHFYKYSDAVLRHLMAL
jgi:hypothetical protein